MNHYQIETTLDSTHGLDWIAQQAVEGKHWPLPPGEATIWATDPDEFHLSAVAEDGTWVKICGPNVDRLQGKRVRVTIEDMSPEVAMRDRAPELVIKYVERWKRSRARDEDDFMSGVRLGWCQLIADLLGRPYNEVREALERGQM